MGATGSKLEKALGDHFPEGERYFGLENFGNTCYCNSVLQEAEEDCSKAISLDKKNVMAYMRRGTARESLLFLKEALKDFKHVCVLEPQNKTASDAEKRLRKMMT